MKKTLYIYSVLTLLFLSFSHPASAVLMTGDGYKLQTQLFNTFTKEKIVVQGGQQTTSSPEDNTDAQVTTSSTGLTSTPDSTFNPSASIGLQITPDNINFGTLAAGEPVQRSIRIQASSQNAFTLQIAQNHPLTSGNTTIPDTSCDDGTCTPSTASRWQSPLVYGFGYSCSSQIPCNGFAEKDFFKPLPDLSKNAKPQILVPSLNKNEITAELTFKVNISPTHAGLSYSNNIHIYSFPNY